MPKFRPDIKPPMWGPTSAVQYAVRHNAERMQVDPSKLLHFYPFFEGAGGKVIDVLSGLNGDITNGSWSRGGVELTGTGFIKTTGLRPLGLQLGPGFTATTVFKTTSTQASSLFGVFNDGINTAFRSAINFNGSVSVAGQFAVYFRSNGGGATSIRAFSPRSSIYDGKSHTLSARIDSNTDVSFFLDDENIGLTYLSTAFNGAVSAFEYDPHIGSANARGTPSLPATATIEAQFISVGLTDAEVAQLHETPYALLMPVARPFIFDLAGGGVTETPGNASISITGLDPIIDITEIPNIDALTITGQDVTEITGFSEVPENASVVVTGLDVNTLISITESPGEVAMTLAGQDVNTAILITEQVLNASLTLVGNDIILTESVIVGGATITINGRQVTVTGDEVINIIRQSGLSIGIRIGI